MGHQLKVMGKLVDFLEILKNKVHNFQSLWIRRRFMLVQNLWNWFMKWQNYGRGIKGVTVDFLINYEKRQKSTK